MFIKKLVAVVISLVIFLTIWTGLGNLVDQFITGTPYIMFFGVLIYKLADWVSGAALRSLITSITVSEN